MDRKKSEVEQLEMALNALHCRPRLIRRDYWLTQIEALLERSGLTPEDRQRLDVLITRLGVPI